MHQQTLVMSRFIMCTRFLLPFLCVDEQHFAIVAAETDVAIHVMHMLGYEDTDMVDITAICLISLADLVSSVFFLQLLELCMLEMYSVLFLRLPSDCVFPALWGWSTVV